VEFDGLNWDERREVGRNSWGCRISRRAGRTNVGAGRFQQIRTEVDLRAEEGNDEEHNHKLHIELSQTHVLSKTELRQERLRGQAVKRGDSA